MHAILVDLHNYLSHLSATDIIVAAGLVSTVATYAISHLFNLVQQRFIKAFLGYIVTPGVVTALIALAGIKPDFFTKYPDVIVLSQIAYYAIERIIAAAQSSQMAPTQGPGTLGSPPQASAPF